MKWKALDFIDKYNYLIIRKILLQQNIKIEDLLQFIQQFHYARVPMGNQNENKNEEIVTAQPPNPETRSGFSNLQDNSRSVSVFGDDNDEGFISSNRQ